MGKIVIGHAIHNDFKALSYTHPAALTRDTSKIPLLNLRAGFGEKECASLKRLTKAIFNRDIQVREVMLICCNWFFDLRNHKAASVVFCPFTSPPNLALKRVAVGSLVFIFSDKINDCDGNYDLSYKKR